MMMNRGRAAVSRFVSAKAFGHKISPRRRSQSEFMKITAIAVAALMASAVWTAGTAHADPMSEVQELQGQISELHDNWDGLTPEQRNQRIAQLQRQVTTVDMDTRNLPPDQQLAVEGPLLSSALELADLLRKAQTSAPQPCTLFIGPPPCGI
jgi:hypothetical protein